MTMSTFETHPWYVKGAMINGAEIYWPKKEDSGKNIDITDFDKKIE